MLQPRAHKKSVTATAPSTHPMKKNYGDIVASSLSIRRCQMLNNISLQLHMSGIHGHHNLTDLCMRAMQSSKGPSSDVEVFCVKEFT